MSYQKLATARSGIKNFKGTRVMKAPMADVVKVLFDPKTLPQWLAGLETVDVLQQSGKTLWEGVPETFEFYQLYKLQPPIWKRDYVIAGRWEVTADKEQGLQAALYLQSIEREDHPIKHDRVRGALNFQVYTLKELPNDQGTEVEVEINVDPSGNFPVFAVNLYGSTWCGKTLSKLEKVVLDQSA